MIAVLEEADNDNLMQVEFMVANWDTSAFVPETRFKFIGMVDVNGGKYHIFEKLPLTDDISVDDGPDSGPF